LIIGVVGFTDKRPVIYTLIKLLESMGDVILISDDRHFRRLLKDHSTLGYFNNVLVAVTDMSSDEVFSEIGYNVSDFDHVLIDVRDMIPAEADLFIYVEGSSIDDEEMEILSCIDEYVTVKVCYEGKDKTCINLVPSSEVFKAVESIEAHRLLVPIPAKEFVKGISELLSEKLNMSSKDISTLLTRGWSKR
jgi:hypothetical protein